MDHFQNTFPAKDRQAWRAQVEKDLKGASYEKKLQTKMHDGIVLEPLYDDGYEFSSEVPGLGSHVRGVSLTSEGYQVGLPLYAENMEDILVGMKSEYARGVNSFLIPLKSFKSKTLASNLPSEKEIKDLSLLKSYICFDAGEHTQELFEKIQKVPLVGSFSWDFIGDSLFCGKLNLENKNLFTSMMKTCLEKKLPWKCLTLSSEVYHNAGASDVQELALLMATAVEYLRMAEEASLPLEKILNHITFRVATSAETFPEMAKIRALRVMWSSLLKEAHLPFVLDLESISSWRMMSEFDPWVNALRTTSSTFAAAVSGVQRIYVEPYDIISGKPSFVGQNLAKNTQIILQEESHLSRVMDPAGGSYFLETLTRTMAQDAWKWFQEIESLGGMISCIRSGFVQKQIGKVRESRMQAFAKRRETLTGISEFPNIQDKPMEKVKREGSLSQKGEIIEALPLFRTSEMFEKLRLASCAYESLKGQKPQVFMANIGMVSKFTARASFTQNFFEVGGIQVLSNLGFETIAEVVGESQKSHAPMVVICGTDDSYAEYGIELAQSLKALSLYVVWAGAPGDKENALRAAGVDDFLFMGCDVVQTLTRLLKAQGVEV